MRRNFLMTLALLAVVGLAAGCSGKTAAVVNGEKILKKDVDPVAAMRMGPGAATMKEADKKTVWNNALQEIIAERLAVQEARARGITVTGQDVDNEVAELYRAFGKDAIDKQVKQMNLDKEGFKRTIRTKVFIMKLGELLVPDGSVTDEEASQFYKSQPAMFKTGQRANVSFLETSSEAQAQQAVAQMKADGGFDSVAQKYLTDKSASVSPYKWTLTSIFGPQLEKTLDEMKPGSFAGPIKVHNSYIIIGLKEKQPAGVMDFSQVKDQIKGMLLSRKRQAALMNLVRQKKSVAAIDIK